MGMHRGTTAAAAVALLTIVLLAGCSGADDGSTGRGSAAPSATRTPRTTPTPTPTPTATTPAVAEPVAETVDAGTVAAGSAALTTATGPANVHYVRQGDFGVVIELDCSGCTGTATVTAPGRMSPFGRASAPMHGSFLTDVFESDTPDQTLIVDADGPWTITLRSWNDLPLVSGAQSGTGPAVLFFRDDSTHVHVEYTPADGDDSFLGRVFTTSDHPQAFGDSGPISEDFDADLPGVMAIQTNGTWTVTPTP